MKRKGKSREERWRLSGGKLGLEEKKAHAAPPAQINSFNKILNWLSKNIEMLKRISKETFVQGHSGGSLVEIAIIAVTPALLFLLAQLLTYSTNARENRFSSVVQFSVLVLPLITQMMGPFSPAAVAISLLALTTVLVARNWKLLKRERSKVPILAMRCVSCFLLKN